MENDKTLSILNTLVELRGEMDRNGVGDIKENDMLYTLAFLSLIRGGIDFTIISKVVGEKEEKKSFISFSTAPKEKEVITKEYIEIKTVMGDFNCSADNIKKYLSESEYNKLILKLSDKPAVAPKSFKIVEEAPAEEVVEEVVDTENEDQFNNNASRLPLFYEDKKFDADFDGKKYLSTMLCHSHILDVTINGSKLKAIFTIYPIKITADDPATDIAVAAALYDPNARSYSSPRGGVSRGNTSSVNIEFDDYVFVVHGAWEKGSFKSYVRRIKKGVTIDDEKIIERIPDKDARTSTTYMMLKDVPGLNIYVFPAVIGENTAQGFILGAIAIEDPEEKSLSILTPTANGEFIVSGKDTEYVLGAYWQGSTPADCVLTCYCDEHED